MSKKTYLDFDVVALLSVLDKSERYKIDIDLYSASITIQQDNYPTERVAVLAADTVDDVLQYIENAFFRRGSLTMKAALSKKTKISFTTYLQQLQVPYRNVCYNVDKGHYSALLKITNDKEEKRLKKRFSELVTIGPNECIAKLTDSDTDNPAVVGTFKICYTKYSPKQNKDDE